MKHPTLEHLEATIRPLGLRQSALILHLLRCAPCAKAARRWLRAEPRGGRRAGEGSGVEVSSYSRLWPGLERSLSIASAEFARAREAAPALANELLALPAQGREVALREEVRFHSLALGWELLAQARPLPLDVRIEQALLAGAIADLLPERNGSQAARAALRSAAGLLLAEALREKGDFRQAEAELEAVAVFLGASADALDRAHWVHAFGLLRRDQSRAEEAFALLDRAADLYAEVGELRIEAEVRTRCGELHLRVGDPREAFEAFDLALSNLLDAREAEPTSLYRAARGAALALVLLERSDEAVAILTTALRTLAGTPQEFRALALRGRIEKGLRRFESAASSLRLAIAGSRFLGKPLTAARDSVYLAEVLVEGSPDADAWGTWFADLIEGLEHLAHQEVFPAEIRADLEQLADALVERALPPGLTAKLLLALDELRTATSHANRVDADSRGLLS